MEKKQTPVKWLVNIVQSCIAPNYIPKEIIAQALQMEREQIIETWKRGNLPTSLGRVLTAEEYYNETYGDKWKDIPIVGRLSKPQTTLSRGESSQHTTRKDYHSTKPFKDYGKS